MYIVHPIPIAGSSRSLLPSTMTTIRPATVGLRALIRIIGCDTKQAQMKFRFSAADRLVHRAMVLRGAGT